MIQFSCTLISQSARLNSLSYIINSIYMLVTLIVFTNSFKWYRLVSAIVSTGSLQSLINSNSIQIVLFQNLDVATLDYCLKELEPSRKELEHVAGRLVWCNRVQCIRPTIQIMRELFEKDLPPDTLVCNFGEVSKHIMRSCRLVDLVYNYCTFFVHAWVSYLFRLDPV